MMALSPCLPASRAAPLLLYAQECGEAHEVEVLLGVSRDMRKSTFYLGVAAGRDRSSSAGARLE